MYLRVHILVRINLQTWLDVFQVLFWKLVVLEWPMKTLLVLIPNDCELCIGLFQHQILWFYELSKFHLALLFIDLPKNTNSNGFLAVKFLPKYLPKIIWLFGHEEKSWQNHIFTRYIDPSITLTQNVTSVMQLRYRVRFWVKWIYQKTWSNFSRKFLIFCYDS